MEVKLEEPCKSKSFRLLSTHEVKKRVESLDGEILNPENREEFLLRTRVKGLTGQFLILPFKTREGIVKVLTQKHDHENSLSKHKEITENEFIEKHL